MIYELCNNEKRQEFYKCSRDLFMLQEFPVKITHQPT